MPTESEHGFEITPERQAEINDVYAVLGCMTGRELSAYLESSKRAEERGEPIPPLPGVYRERLDARRAPEALKADAPQKDAAEESSSVDAEQYDLSYHLAQAIQELDADSIGLAHNMYDATLEQLHEIVAFADRLKEGALVEMYLRERKAHGVNAQNLILPPMGYTGYKPES